MISVVIATYNGELYIKEQLLSILIQTRKPDEVLIFDDRSKDNTVNICRHFVNTHKLSNWKVIINEKNLGYIDNFIQGIKKASGEIILLCDQDDIWTKERIGVIEDLMVTHKDVLSLTTTFSRCDENRRILVKHVKHPYRRSNKLRKIKAEEFFKFSNYLGMSMAIRKKLLESIDVGTSNKISHDILLNTYAAEQDGLFHLDQVLAMRRSYLGSTSNSEIDKELKEQFGGNRRVQTLSRKIDQLSPEHYALKNKRYIECMRKYKMFYYGRYQYIENHSVYGWLSYICYMKYYKSVKEYLGDLLYLFKRNN